MYRQVSISIVVAVPLRITLAVVYKRIVTNLIYLGCGPFEHPKPDLAVVAAQMSFV